MYTPACNRIDDNHKAFDVIDSCGFGTLVTMCNVKLGHNRSEADQQSMLQALESSTDAGEKALGAFIRTEYEKTYSDKSFET